MPSEKLVTGRLALDYYILISQVEKLRANLLAAFHQLVGLARLDMNFSDIENEIDEGINNLDVLNLPLRSVLTVICGVLATPFFPSTDINHDEATAIHGVTGSRFPHLLGLLKKCTAKPGGESALDALSVVQQADIVSILQLFRYAEFCDLAPFVWRGIFSCKFTRADILINHPSIEHKRFEQVDIVLSRLTMPLVMSPPPTHQVRTYIKHQLMGNAQFEPLELLVIGTVIDPYKRWFFANFKEPMILSEDCLKKALDVTYEEFAQFRATCLAFAQFHIDVFHAMMEITGGDELHPLADRVHDWYAPKYLGDFVEEFILVNSGLSARSLSTLMRIFSTDLRNGRNFGDGFSPPFIIEDGDYFFIPPLAFGMMASRNILYSLNKSSRKLFDNEISTLLEPQLIAIVMELLRKVEHIELYPNQRWAASEVAGEFDLLVFSEQENAVLHIQVKAVMPPDGSRLVERLETRIDEGINQLCKFRQLPSDVRDKIISAVVGKYVSDVTIVDSVLCWAGFGTANTWKKLGSVVPINPHVLAHIVDKSHRFTILELANNVSDLLDEIVVESASDWKESEIQFGAVSIKYPSFEVNDRRLLPYKKAFYKLLP